MDRKNISGHILFFIFYYFTLRFWSNLYILSGTNVTLNKKICALFTGENKVFFIFMQGTKKIKCKAIGTDVPF